jgi:hypothetical protein
MRNRDGHTPARDPETGQIVPADNFDPTPKQRKFIALLANGVGPTNAARAAGYSAPGSEATRLRKKPVIRARMREIRELRFDQLAGLSLRRLAEMIADSDTPPNILLQAIVHVHNVTGHTRPKDSSKDKEDNDRDLRDLSLAELEAVWQRRVENTKIAGSGSTIDQEPDAPSDAGEADAA